MSLMLACYTADAFEEWLLPAVDNTNHTLVLDGERYHLPEAVTLRLEVLDGRWSLLPGPDYTLVQSDGRAHELSAGEILRLLCFGQRQITLAVTAAEEELEVFEKIPLYRLQEITIGKAEDNLICVNSLGLVSAHHARLLRRGERWVLEDISRNGTYVGRERITGQRPLAFGECVNIFGAKLVYLGGMLAVSGRRAGVHIHRSLLAQTPQLPPPPQLSAPRPGKERYFRRSPRNLPRVCEDTVEIEGPPALRVGEKRPLLLIIGPSFTMAIPMLLGCMLAIYGRGGVGGGAYLYTGLVTAVTSALLGVMWALINLRYNRKREEAEKNLRFEGYSQYLIHMADVLRDKQAQNAAVLREAYPSAEECAGYTPADPRLWNRNPRHADFLFVRLGTGDVPFQVNIQVQERRFSLLSDALAEQPEQLREQYALLREVPVGVSLLERPMVGLVGRDFEGALDLARLLTVQLAASHCYTEVKLAFLGRSWACQGPEGWAFARWLPHCWSEDRKLRLFAQTGQECREVLYELSRVFRERAEERRSDAAALPHYVLFLDSAALLENEPAAKYILDPRPEYGLTTVLLSQRVEDLPNACEYIIQEDDSYSGCYSVADALDQRQGVHFDRVSGAEAQSFARRLAPVRVNELSSGGDIPPMLDFFDLMGVDALEELDVAGRWKKHRTYESLQAPVGRKAGGVDCCLDIHEKYHGPHGLLAGTTGSGKSETLQTYILSLAVNFSPQDVAFLLIDFKGGGMANLFTQLPHTAGIISNLSGSQIRRAMVSIKSENLRRQRIFGEYGINHIDAYTKLFKNGEATTPIPHLLIIIDEFAELKREQSDFMQELISVAQVGRSLGVHLILATQKPGGTVDDNIRSNTRFRLCLRVQDKQDSVDMIHRPDAAYLTQVGRCYLQVGSDEVFELFQSAWSGARYDVEGRRARTAAARLLDGTGRPAMEGSRAEILRKERLKEEWARTLVESLQGIAERLSEPVWAALERLGEEAFGEAAAQALCESGSRYADSRRSRAQLCRMAELWPRKETDSGAIASYLIQALEEQGEKLPDYQEQTQLDAVVEYLAQVAQTEDCQSRLKLWMPPLPEELLLERLMGDQLAPRRVGTWPGQTGEWTLEAPVGLCDVPESQMQIPFPVDFAANGHYAICGIVDSGKSTFLQTLLFALLNRYSPDHLNVYAMDFSAGKLSVFRDAPQVGGVMDGSDLDKIRKCFRMLERLVGERQRLLSGGDFRQYVKSGRATLPAVLVVIDQYAAFREKTANEYDNVILRLSSVGVGCGVYLVVTAGGFGGAEIPNRLAENFRTTVALEMGDRFKYGDILRTLRFSVLPEANVKGRGLVNLGGSILEFQTALALPAEDDYQRSEAMEARCRALAQSWPGRRAAPVPTIPEHPVWSQFIALEEAERALADDHSLPLGYVEEDASVYSVDLRETFCYLVAGRARTGRTTALRLLLESAGRKGGRVVVVDTPGGELKKCADQVGAQYIHDRKELYAFWRDLLPEFSRRNQKKRPLMEAGASDEELFRHMADEKPIYLIIHDLAAFLDDIYAPPAPKDGVGDMHGFVENVVEKGKLHQVYLFAGFDADKVSQYNGRRAFNAFVGYHAGLYLGGAVDKQRLFTFDNIPYAQRSKATPPGQALAVSTQKPGYGETVVLPQWKG